MKMGDKKPDLKPVHVFYIVVIVVIFLMNFFVLPMLQTSNKVLPMSRTRSNLF